MLEHQPGHFELLQSTDLDETRGLVSRVFCEHQLTLGAQQTGVNYLHQHTRSEAISFSQIRYGAAVRIEPQELGSFFLIQLPLTGHDELECGSLSLQSDVGRGSIHGPDDVFRMNWTQDCTKLAIRIERDTLERHAAKLLDAPLRQPLRFHTALDVRSAGGKFWRQTVRQAMRGLQQGEHPLLHPPLREQVEQLIITSLLAWQPSSISEQLNKPAPTILPRHIKLAEDYMRAHLDAPITNELLADLTGVSVRTLHGGFQKFRGISPMRYLRDLRMAKVREDLLDPSKPRSVTAVAMRWGFCELGRFSAEYKKCFGELPSNTLRKGC